jgi:serine/threonine protein kinase
MVPQVLCDSNITPASDVYSFAIIMYELLTFRTPFHEYSQAKVRDGCRSEFSQVPVYNTTSVQVDCDTAIASRR